MTYAAEQLWEQVAYVAYYFHWSLDTILDMEHADRVTVIGEINKIHSVINAAAS